MSRSGAMKRLILLAALFAAVPGFAQVNDHTLNVCAEDKRTSFIVPPAPPVGILTTGGELIGTLVGVTPLNPEGDLFTEVGVDRNIPLAGGSGPQPTANVDLAVSIVESKDPVEHDEVFQITVRVINNGPDAAAGTTVTVDLPPTLVLLGGSDKRVTDLGTMQPGQTDSLIFHVRANLSAGGTVVTRASVTSAGREIDPEDNEKTESTTITPEVVPQRADLRVGTSFNPQTVKAGETALLVADVVNEGPDGATGVRLAVTLPPELTVRTAEPTVGTCTTSANRVDCQVTALAARAQMRVSMSVGVSSTARGMLNVSANVTGDQQDPNPANNQSTASLTAEEPPTGADLQITKRDSADPVRVGQVIRYTMTVTNLGPLQATNILVTDTLPQGTEFVFCSPTCEPGDIIVRCQIAQLAPGASGSVFVDVRPTQAGTITNRVTVAGDQQDPNSANNNTSENTTVTP